MNGMIVTVVMKVIVAPRAPRTPNLLSQNPAYNSENLVQYDTPKNRVAPRSPKAGYSQNEGAIADKWHQHLRRVLMPLCIAKERKYDHHRGTEQMVFQILAHKAERSHCPRETLDQIVPQACAVRGAYRPHDILLQQVE